VFAMRRQCINALIASGTWASGDAAAASIPATGDLQLDCFVESLKIFLVLIFIFSFI